MIAVVKTGGKQYKVSEGDVIQVEKLDGNVGDTINLKEVLELSLIQKEIEEAREKAEREAAKEAEKNK